MKEIKVELAERAMSWLDGVENFLVAEIPPFIKEVLHYYLFQHTFWVLFSLVMIGASCWVFQKSIRLFNGGDPVDQGEIIPGIVLSGGLALTFVVVAIINTTKLIKLLLAPRLYLLEYFSYIVS